MKLYKLDENGEPVAVDDNNILEWGKAFESQNRVVKKTLFPGVLVSTVFLGIDHSFGGEPLLFETMIFAPDEAYCKRYSTRKEAEVGHKRAVRYTILCYPVVLWRGSRLIRELRWLGFHEVVGRMVGWQKVKSGILALKEAVGRFGKGLTMKSSKSASTEPNEKP